MCLVILPCPFCGSEDIEYLTRMEEDGYTCEGSMICNNCESEGPIVSNMMVGNFAFGAEAGEEIERMAKHGWNNREKS